LDPRLAAAVVFLASGAVLVLEIVGMRLVAPYVGVTLQTSSAVIGVALTAIALGAWAGGRLADDVDPRQTLGLVLMSSGLATAITVPLVRAFGPLLQGGGPGNVVALAVMALFVPSALLASVTPTVVKLQLRDFGRTGTIVGRLSGIGTLGAILATFATGFVLVAMVPSSGIVVGLGGVLLVAGAVLWFVLRRRSGGDRVRLPATAILLGVSAAGVAVTTPTPCQVETAYHCANVFPDPARPATGRILAFDRLQESYVDVADPARLEYSYVQAIASTADVRWPARAPISALYVGGGGLTIPRYISATRPGTAGRVLEIDPAALALSRSLLGARRIPGLQARVGDARVTLRQEAAGSRDLIVGDAFSGPAVPWHRTTREFLREIRRTLRPGGVYAVNVIDFPPNRFARAAVATIRSELPQVAMLASPDQVAGRAGGNFVLVASTAALPVDAIRARMAERGTPFTVASGHAVDAFSSGAPVLTDDYAPVDQLVNSSWLR
jgi:spermidine synthase